MRILYGVVGEGMGHATRSRVVLEHVLSQGHEVQVVVSGRAHAFLHQVFDAHPRARVTEIIGLHLVQDEEGIDRSASLWSNLSGAPEALRHNLLAYDEVASSFHADCVISDFESWAYFYGRAHEIPVISIDNIQVLHRCRHPADVRSADVFNFLLARYSAKVKMPKAYYFLVTSFFFPPVRKPRTTLVPPILRPEILAAQRGDGDHILVYQHAPAVEALLPTLRQLTSQEFRIYGSKHEGTDGHITFRPFSQTGFVDDLASARGVIAGGGFSLMSEAVHLGVPMLSVPLADQYEQAVNAGYLERLGYGQWAQELTEDRVVEFLDGLPGHAEALRSYTPRDNGMTLALVDELLAQVEVGEAPPDTLMGDNCGDYVATAIDDAIGPE